MREGAREGGSEGAREGARERLSYTELKFWHATSLKINTSARENTEPALIDS